MLDQAFGLTSTSRLGCQIILEDAHDGITIGIPAATRNFYVVCHVYFSLNFVKLIPVCSCIGWTRSKTSLMTEFDF